MGNRGESSPGSSSLISSSWSTSSASSSSCSSSSIRPAGSGEKNCSNLAAGRRRSSSEVRRAAIGDAWILEYGEENGDSSPAFDPFDPRDRDGNILRAITGESGSDSPHNLCQRRFLRNAEVDAVSLSFISGLFTRSRILTSGEREVVMHIIDTSLSKCISNRRGRSVFGRLTSRGLSNHMGNLYQALKADVYLMQLYSWQNAYRGASDKTPILL